MWPNANRRWSARASTVRPVTTGQDQTQTLYDAAARTRAAVTDPRFAADVDEAIEYFAPDVASHVGRYDTGELFVPLQVWLGKWEPGASLVLQDRVVLVWGGTEVQHQIIPRRRAGGVAEVDVQVDAVTLWIDCDNPLNVRVRRYAGTMDVPTTYADTLRPEKLDMVATAELPPEAEQCPYCFGEIDKGTEICPHCGKYLGEKPKSKKWLILALLLLLLLLLIVGAVLLLGGDEEEPKPKPTPTATAEAGAEPTQDPFRRISGPGWEGRAPRAFKISGVERQSGGRLLARTLRGDDGLVIRIFHTPEEDANPGSFQVGKLQPLESAAKESNLAIVENYGVPECASRRCGDLLLNDPAWGGIAITVNATKGERLDAAKAIAESIKAR